MIKKKIKNKNDVTFGSILIGVLTFGLLGFSIFNLLTRLNIFDSIILPVTLFVGIGGVIGMFLGFKYPISVETFSFAFTALIIVQSIWDATYDIQGGFLATRVIVGLMAASIFALNIFTGKLKKGTAKKQIRRTLGVKN